MEVAAVLAGCRTAFGSDGKALQAARASETGVRAALFAAAGIDAPRGAAFGDRGVLALWLGVAAPASVQWGDECPGAAGRVAVKPYPSCFLTHSTIDGALASTSLDLRGAADLERMSVEVHPLAVQIADKTTLGGENAKFSIRYCVLAALTDGTVNVDTFSPAAQLRLAGAAGWFKSWVTKVNVRAGAATPALTARIDLVGTDGRTTALAVDAPRGSRSAPLSRDNVIVKFRDNAARAYDAGSAQRLLDEILALPSARDIGALELLTSACTPADATAQPHVWGANGNPG